MENKCPEQRREDAEAGRTSQAACHTGQQRAATLSSSITAQHHSNVVAPSFVNSQIQTVNMSVNISTAERKDSRCQAAQHSDTQPVIDMQPFKEKNKARLREEFAETMEGTGDERTLLNSIFIPLYMTTGESEGVNKEHEIMQTVYPSKGKPSSETSVHYRDIFNPRDEQQRKILTVLTKGIAGIGKTISVHMFILDWAEGKSNQDIDFIFFLPFRELNLIKRDFSLQGLLKEFHPELEDIEDVEKFNNHKVLFILDGMDESRCPLDFQHNERVSDVTKECPVDVLLTNIMKKNLLPSALLWITSRPAAASQIPRRTVNINLETEVRGFQEEQRLEYFRKRFSDDEDLANRIIEHIRTTRSLYIMCYIPIMCWIIAKVLEHMLTENNSGNIPQSLTEMYIHFLITQTKCGFEKYQGVTDMDDEKVLELSKDLILKLGQVAFEQLVKGSVIFYAEDLRKCGIDVDEAAVKCGLCTEILKVERGLYKKKMYCFVHLSFQEFLAALYVFYCCVTKNISALESFLENVSAELPLHELLKRVVDKALQSKNGHLDLFLRFLLGISLESNQTLLQGLLPQTENISETVEEMRKYLRKPDIENISPERHVNLFLCLTEMKDSSVHEDIHQFLMSPDCDALSEDHCSALANALLMSQGELDEMDQRKYNIHHQVIHRLVPAFRKCRKAVLTNMELNHEHCASLASSLQSPDCSLTELHLEEMYFDLSVFCAALRGPHCKLEILRLNSMHLRHEDCASLASFLQSPDCPLRELHLERIRVSGYDDDDGDLSVVCAALRGPHCKLETLRLINTRLSHEDCASLASSLQSPDCPLTELHLEGITLSGYDDDEDGGGDGDDDDEDGDLSVVIDALRGPHSKLETLRLNWCDLIEDSYRKLSSALSSNCLRELDLSHNNLQDSGVKLLSDGLKSPHCRLKILRLSFCGVTEEGCASLASALISNCRLRELDLSFNHPGDTVLSGPLCRLEKLNVDHNEEIWVKPQLLKKYACDLTLDPNTAHIILSVSEDNRRVEWVKKDQPHHCYPEQFDEVEQVLCREGLTGRHYWEVELGGEVRWHLVGVTYRSIRRRGRSAACTLGDNDRSWCLELSGSVWHNHEKTLIPIRFPPFPSRVGVYLDWPAGVLSFYSISSDTMTHLYTFNTTFSEPLYPAFRLYSSSSVTLRQVE
ncbi:NACHT, LRR and PYD domains-containing protein 12-like [Osmerus eperlanus]|uniref:NACHT, LRR and PYD domains-containing protein 12-like n=1 Tax=Osmerus eperlanus TaxID=29151 RepID=UPI002E15EB5D